LSPERVALNRNSLLEEFVSVDSSDEGIRLHVRTISWRGPHTPVSEWVLWKQINAEPDHADLDRLYDEILADRRYFGLCAQCRECNPFGWMHDPDLCQSCAERHHGVMY